MALVDPRSAEALGTASAAEHRRPPGPSRVRPVFHRCAHSAVLRVRSTERAEAWLIDLTEASYFLQGSLCLVLTLGLLAAKAKGRTKGLNEGEGPFGGGRGSGPQEKRGGRARDTAHISLGDRETWDVSFAFWQWILDVG